MNQSEFFYVDDPTVAMLKDGTSGVAWVDNRRRDVLFRAFDADAGRPRSAPVNVSRSPNVFSWLPRVAMTANDRVYALWQEIVFSGGSHGGEAFFARSLDGGAHFEEPLNLSQSQAGVGKGRLTADRWDNGSLALAVDGRGTILTAFTEYEGALRFTRSTDGGASFAPPRQIAGSHYGPARGPSLAAGAGEAIYLAWAVGDLPDANIHLAVSDDGGGSFGEPRVVHQTSGHSDAPSLVADNRGRVHLVYGESPSGPQGRREVVYTWAEAEGLTFTPGRIVSGELGTNEGAGFPSITVDEHDRLFILWEHYPDYDERPRGLGFILSTDGGDTFSAPVIVPGTTGPSRGFNGGLQGLLTHKLAATGGAVSIVGGWFQPNEQSLVRLVRGHVE
jgi:hypothetical protein